MKMDLNSRPDTYLTQAPTPNNRLQVIDRSKVDPQLAKAAEGMESMFLDYMMKVMRKTVPRNEMSLESNATRIYRGMLDSEWAEMAARKGGIGLADLIIASVEPNRYPRKRAADPRRRDTGGIYEGRKSHAKPSESSAPEK